MGRLWIEPCVREYDRAMKLNKARCLILACGNTLRGDDGIGPWLADWAAEQFSNDARVRVISRQQWTPELAEEIAAAESVIFIDCSATEPPGSVSMQEVHPAAPAQGLATHHIDAAELLALSQELYNSLPRNAHLVTVGAGSMELSEAFSQSVLDAIPAACATLDQTVTWLLGNE